ncbi:MAG: ABC transporter permease, partial [Saprospiraceae bacterium]
MIKFLFRRFLYALLLLWIISIIAFWLSKRVPGDEVLDYLSIDDRGYSSETNPIRHRIAYRRIAKQRGLDLPGFYFSISPSTLPDSINSILPFGERDAVNEWITQSGHPDHAFALHQQLREGLMLNCANSAKQQSNNQLCQFYDQALAITDVHAIRERAIAVQNELMRYDSLPEPNLGQVIALSNEMLQASTIGKNIHWLPAITWHGTNNQYHQWMSGLLLQKPLTSLVDGRNAWSKIYDALKWTALLNGIAFLLALFFGVVIGIWSGTHDGTKRERYTNWILFAFFAIPSFWLGTLLIYFFSSGEWLSIFPAGGLGPYHSADNFFGKFIILSHHFFLPVTCLAIGALAYISRQMKQSVLHEYRQPYVRSLRAQGISENTITRKHVIRNALFPVITIIGGSIPALLSGSLIIEVIFSIPGM